MSNLHRGPAIDASYQISVHLAERVQRRKKSANQKQELPIMNRTLVGSIYGRSSIKIAHFVPIRYQTWLPQTILVSDWLISKKSSPLKPEDFSEINQSETRIVCGSYVCKRIGTR
jgi:hypothetical protein